LSHHRFELLVAADRELPETAEELLEVLDGTVAEHLRLAVIGARQPFLQMLDELGELFRERGFRQTQRIVEAGLRPAALFAVEIGMQPPEVIRRLDRRKIPREIELARKGPRLIRRI
jgi:hypothetical protein